MDTLTHVNKIVSNYKFMFELYVVRVEFINLQSASSLILDNTRIRGTQ